tara:strand:+ start:664 stop:1734 length:1071 start_codon:yes stop_codon:yes gene_type:complete
MDSKIVILLKKISKVFTINFILVLFFVSFTELFFGYWFDDDNFGPYMREHRMKNQRILWKDEKEEVEYFYRRNYYGFRGRDISPSEIEGVILGGSVIDERYKPEKYTITEFLNKKLKKNNSDIKFINGGIEAQTTAGMVSGFDNWLLKLENFHPKYIIFYVGINDAGISENIVLKDAYDGHMLNPNSTEVFFDNIKSRSILLDSFRKFKFKYLPRKGFVKYDGKVSKDYIKKYNFIEYDYAIKNYDLNILKNKYKKRIKNYITRIDRLEKYSRRLNSIPIFITNIGSNGFYELLFILNKSLINHCIKNAYNCIDLASKLNPEIDLWIDDIHTTKKGSEAIADEIYINLEKIITKIN